MVPLYFPKAYFFTLSLLLLKFIAVLSLQPFDKIKFLSVTCFHLPTKNTVQGHQAW